MSEEVKKAAGENGTPARTGPRGGTTTVSDSGMVKKNLWVPEEMGRWLRDQAYHLELAEAEIMRLALHRLRADYERTGEWPKA